MTMVGRKNGLVRAFAGVSLSSEARSENDYYPTPPVATFALAQHHPLPRRIYEPAAGRGWMSETLREMGHDVAASDLFEYSEPLGPVEFGVDFLRLSQGSTS